MHGPETIASPAKGNASFVTLLRLTLPAHGEARLTTDGHEHVLDILSGTCEIVVQEHDGTQRVFAPVGGRMDIFSGKPEFVYVPRDATYTVRCTQAPFEAAIATAPTERRGPAVHISQDTVRVSAAGVSDWQRDVYVGLGDDGPAATMLVGETESPPGNWSGFPPHRHTLADPPAEAAMEELYYFKFKPSSGFAIGGTYQDAADRGGTARLYLVGDSQIFDAARGYHFIAPCPGYRLRYMWVLGGPQRKFGAWRVDPDLAWLLNYKEPGAT